MNTLTHTQAEDSILLEPLNKEGLAAFAEKADDFTRNYLASHQFEASFGSCLLMFDGSGNPKQVLVGMEKPPSDPRRTVQLMARVAAMVPAGRTYHAAAEAFDDWHQAATGWMLQGYRFSKYVNKEEKPGTTLCVPDSVDCDSIRAQTESIFLARDMINTPASGLGTREMIEQAREVAETYGASFTVIEGNDLLENNYPSIHTVGKGSERPPALIDLRWGDESHPKLTLVGKGVVFDSGGLNLKGGSNMLLMKKDMGGAAVTLALAKAVMDQALPVRLRLLIPTVENTPGAKAYRPGDVIRTRKKISIEIGNTDAEGRVILCDALAEAVTEEPDLIIDMATLTGAARIALGQDLPGFWTPSDSLAAQLNEAANEVADPVWRMPLWRPYRKNLKSAIADMNNMGNTAMGGSITAALFLHEFVKPHENWIHVDMYGWRTDNSPECPKGGEASALRAIFRFLSNRYAK